MRTEGWESLLATFLEDASPFLWGTRDCALWSAGWVRLCTGTDFGASWRGKYRTGKGAATLMRKRGFLGVADIASAHLEEIPVSLARRGDLLLHPDSESLGVCSGLHGCFLTEHGRTRRPALSCARAWRV